MAKQDNTDKRGFASMDKDKVRHIASMGGSKSGGNFKHDRERAREAGRKGGQARRTSDNEDNEAAA